MLAREISFVRFPAPSSFFLAEAVEMLELHSSGRSLRTHEPRAEAEVLRYVGARSEAEPKVLKRLGL